MRPLEQGAHEARARPSLGRPYLFELDLIRAVTALCVIAVHVSAATLFFYHSAVGVELQSAVTTALHFTREIFLTLSAFVLVYGSAYKPFAFGPFWRKRGIGVLLPYIFWSLFYVWFAAPHVPFGIWMGTAVFDTLTGSASYQLYYILLSLELYLVLPLLLWFLHRVERHPWMVLGLSFAVQLLLLYLDYHVVQTGPLALTGFGQWANTWQDRLLFVYQFPIMLGAVAALHQERVRAFVVRHGGWMVAALALGLGVHWLHYALLVVRDPGSLGYAVSPLQPTVVVYGLAVTLCLYWLACRWAEHASSVSPPRGYGFWKAVSNASFGIYLIHVFILTTVVLPYVAPSLPAPWPAGARAAFVWLLVAVSSTCVSLAFLYIPGLSRLMGRACLLAPESLPMRALTQAREWVKGHAVKWLGTPGDAVRAKWVLSFVEWWRRCRGLPRVPTTGIDGRTRAEESTGGRI